jgi:Ca2+-binding EF-hand superfamily protein
MKGNFKEEFDLRKTFSMLDKDGDGKITAKELKEVLGNNPLYRDKPSSFWDDMIKEADQNGDGIVSPH